MPLTDDGHWWELSDESRGGTPYYYHTKTGETQWTRPEGFVIPLGIIQTTTALGRRLSQTTFGRASMYRNSIASVTEKRLSVSRRSRSFGDSGIPEEEVESLSGNRGRRTSSESLSSLTSPPLTKSAYVHGIYSEPLSTIPASPEATSAGGSTPTKKEDRLSEASGSGNGSVEEAPRPASPSPPRAAQTPLSHVHSAPTVLAAGSPPQSLRGAAETLAAKESQQNRGKKSSSPVRRASTPPGTSPIKTKGIRFPTQSPVQKTKDLSLANPPSPKRPLPVPAASDHTNGLNQPRRTRHDTEASAVSNATGRDIGDPKPDPGTSIISAYIPMW